LTTIVSTKEESRMSMERWSRAIGLLFTAELLLILGIGSVAAWRLDDAALHAVTVVGALAWLLLAAAGAAGPRQLLSGWRGPLQFVACWLIFPLFKAIRQVFIAQPSDAALLRLDRWLWGGASLPEHLFAWERPWLSEVLSAGYFLFYFVVLVPALVFAWRRRSHEARVFFTGLSAMYLVGFIGYAAVPAGGPYLAFPELFPYPVHGGAITAFLTGIVKDGITGMDVFPSLHAGIGVYVLGFFTLGGYRRIALVLAPVVTALVMATVYLRYHYGIDLLWGLALAAAVLCFVQTYRKERPL
jgi:hypothetical protein